MTSIRTNTSALTALQTLRGVGQHLSSTQQQVSSGLRVSRAADNAAYWSIATTMKSDEKAISAVQDALGLGAAVVDTMYNGMSSAIDLVSEFKAKLVAATEDGVDKTKINDELTQIKAQLRSIAYGSQFNGQQYFVVTDDNWQPFVDEQKVAGAFVRGADGSVSVQTISVTPSVADLIANGTSANYMLIDDTGGASTGDIGILTSWRYARDQNMTTEWVITHTQGAPNGTLGTEISLTNGTRKSDIDDMISVVEAMHQQMVTVAARYGSVQTRIKLQQDFASNLADSILAGVGRLIDADMEQESAKLTATQAQQQLAIQSLSIANQTPQNILSLFQR
jgi:flagellin